MTKPMCKTCKWWSTRMSEPEYDYVKSPGRWFGTCCIRSFPGPFPHREFYDFCGEHTEKEPTHD